MKFTPHLISAIIGTATVITLVQPHKRTMAQSPEQVASTAKQITVLIEGQNPGSGVLIRREGNTYTVLTARHVVATPDEYDIVTPDGQKHKLNYKTVKPLSNVDLAILEFTSTSVYPIARLGNSRTAPSGTTVYVAGFPVPTAAITQSIFNFTEGKMTANADRPLADGYALVYSNSTLPGMSGGPVLNISGEVIGIHGKGDTDTTRTRATPNPNVAVKTGFNLAIPINTFLSLASGSGIIGFVAPAAIPQPSDQPKADDFFLQANVKLGKQDYRGAIADYTQAIRLNPNYVGAYINRGIARRRNGDLQGALADYDKVIQLDPNDFGGYVNRANVRLDLGDPKGALADADQAIRIDPKAATAHYNRGVALDDLRDYTASMASYNQVIRLDPQYIGVYLNRGAARHNLRDLKGAIQDYDQELRLDSSSALTHFNRGAAYQFLGERSKAIADFRRAAELAGAQGNNQLAEQATRKLQQLQ
jgi:lipoprotein NlpI